MSAPAIQHINDYMFAKLPIHLARDPTQLSTQKHGRIESLDLFILNCYE